MAEESNTNRFDLFELFMAIVLGLGAVGGSWAGYQGGLWAGNQATSYAEAANKTTEAASAVAEASSDFSVALAEANRDANIGLLLSRLVIDNVITDDEMLKTKNKLTMKFVIANQLSANAQNYIELDEDKRGEKWDTITDEELDKLTDFSLDDDYVIHALEEPNAAVAEARGREEEAKKLFLQGRKENFNGDKFALTGVLFTVCLFLAGIGLVFKTRVRWVFGGLAAIALVVAMGDLFTNPWTKSSPPPTDSEAGSAAVDAASGTAEESEPAATQSAATEPAEPAPSEPASSAAVEASATPE